VIHNRYRLEQRLGVGGMGAVYKAKHLFLDRVAAIKIIQPEQRSQEHFRAWFLREARAVNMINHAHVVEIYDYGETEDGLAYLVEEFLDGVPLSNVIARGPAELRRTVDVLEQSCAALARAHDLGVIHRDLKPDNIYLLEKGGRKDFVKLLDFGLARVIREGRLAEEGAVFGTPEYISPEQARGEDAGPTSDLYSMGVIFYEMITGRLPFDDRDRDRLFSLHQHQPPPAPSSINAEVDIEVERIILRLLAKSPADRFRDAHHLLEELKVLQRAVPASELREPELRSRDQEARPRAVLPEFSQWAIKSAVFSRMVARAYPDGKAPEDVRARLEHLWQNTAAAAMVEGELAAEARRLEQVEGKLRGIRAQLGRKIEELSREVSRLQREIESSQTVLERSRRRVLEVEEELLRERKSIDELEARGASAARLKEAYERTGAMHANFIARRQQVNEMEQAIINRREEMDRLEERIQTYRRELDGRSDSLSSELTRARDNVEGKGAEAARHRKDLVEAATYLTEQLYPREECREMFDELDRLTGSGASAQEAD
jgi:serine/threonine-protein kinase